MGFLKDFVKGVGGIFKNPMQALTIVAAYFIPGGGIWLAALATASAAYGNYQTKRMQEKAKAAYNNSLQDRLTNALTAEEPFQVIYGTAKVGGAIVAVLKSGDRDQYRHIVMVHAAHEVEEIGDVYINGTNIGALDANGDVQAGSKYYKDGVPYVLVRKHLGTPTDTADSTLLAECSAYWSTDHLLRGFAYTVVKVHLGFEEFQSGLPQIAVVIKGKKLYDPRTSTTYWSSNPALCIYDYLTSEYGANQNPSSLVLSTFIDAANDCDDVIGVGNRYTCNGSFKTDQDPKQILDTLADSMAGFISQSGGWMVHAGVYKSPVLDLDESDTVGGVQISPAPSLNDVFNTVTGQYSNPDKDYLVTDYQPYKNSSYLTADGQELSIDYALLFTNSNQRCQNIARVVTERARSSLTIKAKFTLKAWPLQCGDRITYTNSAYGWTNKVFRVTEWNFSPNEPVELVLQEDSAGIYDEADDVLDDNYPGTGLPDSYIIGAPTGLIASSQNVINSDGSLITSLYVTWNYPTLGFATQYEIQWYASDVAPVTEDLYSTGFSNIPSFIISPIIGGSDYYIRVRSINRQGAKSDWVTYTTASSGDLIAPGVPTSVVATAAKQSVVLTWINPTDADLNTVEIWVNTSATLIGISKVTEIKGERFTHDNIGSNITRYYYLRAKDNSGNLSAWTSVVSATTEYNLADQIANEILTTAAFANGITPVEIVGALPTTGNFEGRLVYLTTDNKVYRHTGSPSGSSGFIRSTDGADITANSITAGKIAAGAIGTDQLAANAITAGKIAANQIFAAGISVASAGAGVTVAGNTSATAPDGTVITNGVYVFQNSQTLYGFVAENKWSTNNGGGAAYFTSKYGFTADFYMSQNASHPNAALKNCAIAASANSGGNVSIGVTGANGGYAGYAASGTWSPFTGSHDGLLAKDINLDIGDIVIDNDILVVKVSDSLTTVIPSNVAMQKGALGVFVSRRDLTAGAPAAFVVDDEIENPIEFNALAIDYDNCVINGVGEGAINVCGENGNINKGDLIVTSSILGKGMKQNDDIIHSYTVAKARESVTFDSPNQVKMIACIYLCG